MLQRVVNLVSDIDILNDEILYCLNLRYCRKLAECLRLVLFNVKFSSIPGSCWAGVLQLVSERAVGAWLMKTLILTH